MPYGRQIIRRWALTQRLNMCEQLEAGIRYFDMRISVPNCSLVKGIRVLHALYGRELQAALTEINDFLKKHPKEVIILDFNHFYNFDTESCKSFLKILESSFGLNRFCPRRQATEVSLNYMWENSYQIIAICANLTCTGETNWVWGSECILSPYPNVNRLDLLFQILEETMKHHREAPLNRFYVTQAILTARIRDVCLHLFSSLEEVFARKCTQKAITWISDYPKPSSFNIIICDFVEIDNYCKSVIGLNYKTDL